METQKPTVQPKKHLMVLLVAVAVVPMVVILIIFMTKIGPQLSGLTNQTINNFDDCIAAGNPIMESYPRQCRAGDQTFTEKIAGELFECSEESRKAEVCAEIYQPVCATVQVQCLTTPCDALLVTYPNACDACRNLLVTQYTEGECE